jgi:hypothetical protein
MSSAVVVDTMIAIASEGSIFDGVPISDGLNRADDRCVDLTQRAGTRWSAAVPTGTPDARSTNPKCI